jgi:formylglycine-generating enzyme required for sulfatase activity
MLNGVPSRRYRFASFEFREKTGELWRSGLDLHLPDHAGQVLLALLQASGEVVSRESLKGLLWPDKAHGDFEGGINAAVRKLRQVLADDGAEPRFIGTLPRRGYRMLVPVESCEDGPGDDAGALPNKPIQAVQTQAQSGLSRTLNPDLAGTEIPSRPTETAQRGVRGRRNGTFAGILATFLVVVGFLAFHASRKIEAPVRAVEEVPGFVRVPSGQFLMGSPLSEANRCGGEIPHLVTISRNFLMAKYDVTVREFEEFVLATGYLTEVERKGNGWVVIGGIEQPKPDASWRRPYFQQSDMNPVVLVAWDDAISYCNWRSEKEGLPPAYIIKGSEVRMDLSAKGYRLPTEAEWEFAARGGQDGARHYTKYAGSDDFDEVAWCSRNSGNGPHPVGQKRPNALGLYDMSGNVDQWCWDLYGAYPSAPQVDPVGGHTGIGRVRRGGSWLASPGQYVRIAFRYNSWTEIRTTIGFRVVRNP